MKAKKMNSKISYLVSQGYKEAAFANKQNAEKFARKWHNKGYSISALKSAGPTVEGSYRKSAYYVVARRKKR